MANEENNDEKIGDALQKRGLDKDFWEPKLKDILSIDSIAALKYLDKTDFLKLKSLIRYNWEKKAIMDLMGIENDSKFGLMRSSDKEKAKERMDQGKKLVGDLIDLKKKGKDLCDREVKEKMNKICSALEIN